MKYDDFAKLKWKIYWQEFNEFGDEIARGVYPKEYKNIGNAINIAKKNFGDREKYKYEIYKRSPWEEYTSEAKCDICGCAYTVHECADGWALLNSIHTLHRYPERGRELYHSVCGECYSKITKFIDSLKESK